MDTLKELFKVGNGPSSSHTMGPQKAAAMFLERNKDAEKFVVELYGSLALTGKGHLTDWIIKKVLGEKRTEINFCPDIFLDFHPNGMKFFAYQDGVITAEWLVFSVGGGTLKELDEYSEEDIKYYKYTTMHEILEYTERKGISLLDYVLESEPLNILDYARMIIEVMFASVERGLTTEGVLPGALKLKRRAPSFYQKHLNKKDLISLVFASALAVSEENASGNVIVTAPTCGSSGVIPGVLYALSRIENIGKERLAKALLVGGLIGNLVKHNASISGAEVGCQGEVGTACAMAAAAAAYLKGGNNNQIEYAAEIALEHHLGMTCDPVMGYVQIPCIERNALSACRALDSCNFALLTDGEHYIDLDTCIISLKETGKDLNPNYRETSLGGLAKSKIVR
ncbi:MAG TPA: serine dehydratase [Acholeplasmataceae bacterium]|nr:serine dehydratase [Acholeplasmataceae bacterium]